MYPSMFLIDPFYPALMFILNILSFFKKKGKTQKDGHCRIFLASYFSAAPLLVVKCDLFGKYLLVKDSILSKKN